MNFRAAGRSESKPMLRRIVLAVLVWALAAGFVTPGEAASAGMGCEQISLQFEGGCDTDSMAATACALPCPAGTCINSALLPPEPTASSAQPFASTAAQTSDGARPPDTAPPKHSIA